MGKTNLFIFFVVVRVAIFSIFHVTHTHACKPISYTSQQRKVISTEFDFKTQAKKGRLCTWVIDPNNLESYKDPKETSKGEINPVFLKIRSLSLPPGTSVWVFNTFQISNSNSVSPSDPNVVVAGNYSYLRPNADNVEGSPPSSGLPYRNKLIDPTISMSGFAVDLVECAKQLRSKNTCHQAVLSLLTGTTKNASLQSVGLDDESLWDISETVVSKYGKFLVLLDMSFTTKQSAGSEKTILEFSYGLDSDNGNESILATLSAVLLLGIIGWMAIVILYCVFRTNSSNRVIDALDARQRAIELRAGTGGRNQNQGATIQSIQALTILYTFQKNDVEQVREELQKTACGDEALYCSICLSDVFDTCTDINDTETEVKARLLPCSHIFHAECIEGWLKLKKTCPMCKLDIAETVKIYKRLDQGEPSETARISETYIKSRDRFRKFEHALEEFKNNDDNDDDSDDDSDENSDDNGIYNTRNTEDEAVDIEQMRSMEAGEEKRNDVEIDSFNQSMNRSATVIVPLSQRPLSQHGIIT